MKNSFYIDWDQNWSKQEVLYAKKMLKSAKCTELKESPGGKGGGPSFFDLLKYQIGLIFENDTLFLYLSRLAIDAAVWGAIVKIYKKLSTRPSTFKSRLFREIRNFIGRPRTIELSSDKIEIFFSLDEGIENNTEAIRQLEVLLKNLRISRNQSVTLIQKGDSWLVWWYLND